MLGISPFVSIRAALLLPVILSACASFETSEVKLGSIRTVGIISAVGDEFSFTTAGLAGFDSGDRRYSVELDDPGAFAKRADQVVAWRNRLS